MKALYIPLVSLVLLASSCGQKSAIEPDKPASNTSPLTCVDESTLEVYQDREAVVVLVGEMYCLSVAPEDVADPDGVFRVSNVLVPATPIASQFRVARQHVLLTGRKKSCDRLLTLPNLKSSFGHKLEVDNLSTTRQ